MVSVRPYVTERQHKRRRETKSGHLSATFRLWFPNWLQYNAKVPSGSTVFARLRASEVARSTLAGVTAKMRHVSFVMYCRSMSRICASISTGWSPTAILVKPGKSISVIFNTVTKADHHNQIIKSFIIRRHISVRLGAPPLGDQHRPPPFPKEAYGVPANRSISLLPTEPVLHHSVIAPRRTFNKNTTLNVSSRQNGENVNWKLECRKKKIL